MPNPLVRARAVIVRATVYKGAMSRRAFDLIAFDGDDTLWHNERSYREGRHRFRRLLAGAGVVLSDEEIEASVNRTELANLEYYGYGVSSFVLSLIETAIDLTDGRIAGGDLRGITDLAKHMLREDIELFESVREVLTALASSYLLMLVTKGDLLHQTSKLERSGLRDCFRFVEVVSHKTAGVYSAILSRHGIDPDRFLMIGNSLRSDVLPVVEAGGWAVHVPAAVDWSHEHADVPAHAKDRYFELPSLDGLPPLIARLEQAMLVDRDVVRRRL
jgi:putative hydrolase of the HAD superfamily